MQKLTRKDNKLVVSELRPLEIYTVLVLEYLALILIVSFAARKIEQRMQSDARTPRWLIFAEWPVGNTCSDRSGGSALAKLRKGPGYRLPDEWHSWHRSC
jgi:hypothetical protein